MAKDGQLIAHKLIYRNTAIGIQVSGRTDVRIVSNTLYSPVGDLVRIDGGSREIQLTDNIFWAGQGYDIYVANNSQTGFWSDYNLLYASGTGRLVHWSDYDCTDLLDWQEDVARFDLHSMSRTAVNPDWSEPRFESLALDDFRTSDLLAGLRFSNLAVNSGDPISDLALHSSAMNLLTNGSFESLLDGWNTNPAATGGDYLRSFAVNIPQAALPGDYDRNGAVEQADHVFWMQYFGATSGIGLQADGNGDGVVNAADYSVWRDNLGATGASGQAIIGVGYQLPDATSGSVSAISLLDAADESTGSTSGGAAEMIEMPPAAAAVNLHGESIAVAKVANGTVARAMVFGDEIWSKSVLSRRARSSILASQQVRQRFDAKIEDELLLALADSWVVARSRASREEKVERCR